MDRRYQYRTIHNYALRIFSYNSLLISLQMEYNLCWKIKFCTDCPSDNLLIASATLITLPSICFSEHEVTTNINNKKNFHIYLIPFLFITLKVVKYHLSSLITLFNRFRLHHKAKTSILVTIILNVVINVRHPTPLAVPPQLPPRNIRRQKKISTLKRPSRMDRLTTLLVFFSVQITAPLPNIATHIIQSQFIAFFSDLPDG